MPTPSIIRGSDYMFSTIYEGNGGGQKVGKFVPFTDSGTITNSCIFNGATNNYLSRTPGSNGSTTTLTFSAWVKRGRLGSQSSIFFTNDFSAYGEQLEFLTNNTLQYACTRTTAGVNDWNFKTNRTFEDTSKWYHIFIKRDTTNSTQADRVQIYVDGERITSFSTETLAGSSAPGWWNQTNYANIMGNAGNASYLRGIGYLAEVNMIDGTAMDVSDFGVTDTSTGRWIPKTLSGITYGTNGFRLKFQDSSALGDDTSGNTNDFTATNLASTNQTTDSPTQNFMTFFLEDSSAGTLSQGNLLIDPHTNSGYRTRGTQKTIPQSGKWYMEVKLNVSSGTAYRNHSYGVLDLNQKQIQGLGTSVQFDAQVGGMGMGFNGDRIGFVSLYSTAYDWRLSASSPHSMVNGDFVLMAFDMDNGKAWWGTRDTSGTTTYWYNSSGGTDGDPSTGANPTFTFIPRNHRFMVCQGLYPDSGATLQWYFGSQGFNLTAPTDYGKLSQENFPETGKGISDFVWIKNRDATDAHQIYDSNRGPQKDLNISTVQESTTTDGLQKFLKGGFAIEDDVSVNTSGESYVSWNWVCNGGTTSANTSATPTIASNFQVNDTAGFSIIQHTGNGTNGATIEHGLSQAPTFLITKNTSTNNRDWMVWHHKLTDGSYFVDLNQTEAQIQSTSYTNSTAPSSTVITLGTSAIINGNGESYVTYAFYEVPGFSKFGKYTGNGSTNGPFVSTGFKPSWLIVKRIDSANDWELFDSVRNPFNPVDRRLYPNLTNVEAVGSTTDIFDFTSNGFKVREDNAAINASSGKYIYIAFAEHPFVGNGTNPVTAR